MTRAKKLSPIIFIAALFAVMIASCSSARKTRDDEPAATQQKIWTPRWLNLGGDAQGDPAIASWGSNHLSVFWRGTDNSLKHRMYTGGWSSLENLGGDVKGSPAVVSKELNHLDVFYFNSSGDLVRHYFPGPNWQWAIEAVPLPAGDRPALNIGAGPAVASWSPGRLDVFWRAASGNLKHISRDNYTGPWTGVENLGGLMSTDPAAISWGYPNIDVFYRDYNGALAHAFYPACIGCNFWGSQAPLTGSNELINQANPGAGVGVASWAPGRLDVFWRRTSGTLGHTWRWESGGEHDANWAGGIEDLGGYPGSGVDAVSWSPGRIDVVAKQAIGYGSLTGNDVTLLTWQTQSQSNPWYNDPPPLPTIAISEHVVTTGQPWEFSAVVAPQFTNGCSGGGYVVSGQTNGTASLRQRTPLSAGASTDKTPQLGGNANLLIESDSMMTRAPNGDLLLLRGTVFDNSCGVLDHYEEANCTWQSCPGTSGERRTGSTLYRSSDCGQNWTSAANDKIDPLLPAYGSGFYGGGPCWGGWDREEMYFDSFSNRLFFTMGAGTAWEPDQAASLMFRSQPGGVGPYSMHRFGWAGVQPIMMTSLPGMMFFATCEGSKPTLRWMEPENPHWDDYWTLPFPQDSSGMRYAQLSGNCGYDSIWGLDGSESVSRVGTYSDDSGTQWWVVRVAVHDSVNARIITVRVNSAGTVEELFTQVLTANNPPSGQAFSKVMQLAMIEPDPSQTQLLTLPWSGENTTLYYWREEYWDVSSASKKINQANIVRARAVRDVNAYGPVFDVSGWGTSVVTDWHPGNKPGDFARGGFWFDRTAAGADIPLRYLVTWVDINPSTTLRAKAFAFPRGFGNQ